MKTVCVAFVVALVAVFAVVSESAAPFNGIPSDCLGCICEAVSNCNLTLTCSGNVCGLFRITWAYWADAGKPTQQGESPDSQNAYSNCVNEPFCAARAVQGYMAKFNQDCNNDGVIDCQDFAAIHKLGGYGCNAPLPDYYTSVLNQCLTQVQQAG